jgi:nicotinate-nucleotide pyrophosphorylase (carboxylating)
MYIPPKILEAKLIKLLYEDVGQGDITSHAIIPKKTNIEAVIISKEEALVAGIEEFSILANFFDLKFTANVSDGSKIVKNQTIISIYGDALTILALERTILNLMSRMSGIATITNKLVTKLQNLKINTRIAATRKTVPGLNYFDKKAVLIGGGDIHRMNLADLVLIKDNHIVVAGSIQKAIDRVKKRTSFSKKIEVEVTNFDEMLYAAKAGVDIIMLDNFTPAKIKKAMFLLKKEGYRENVLIEVSGGITQKNYLEYASTQVDIISMGSLTHNVKSIDLTLEIKKRN